jgi:hypothetical protein
MRTTNNGLVAIATLMAVGFAAWYGFCILAGQVP